MSDAAVDLGATDLFSLGTGFHAQESSTEPTSEEALAQSEIGDMACVNFHNKMTNYRARYKYCGTGLKTALGDILTAFGGVVNGILPTDLEIAFSSGAQAEITLSGHNHTTNPHSTTNPPNTFDISGALGTGAGLGVPELIVAAGEAGGTASRQAATLSFGVNHIDKEANSGHFVGESVLCRCDLSVDYEGVPGTITEGSWLQVLVASNDANEDLDTAQLTAHRYFDAT